MKTNIVSAGLLSALLACTGGAILIVQAAEALGLSQTELQSWVTSVYVLGGVLNLGLTLKYKIPFAGAHSITAIAFLGTLGTQFSLPDLVGGYMMSGALLVLAGVTGIFSKALDEIPKSVINALLAGLLLPYVIGMAPAVLELPITGVMAGIGYFFVPRVLRMLPPTIWALLCGLIGLLFEIQVPMVLPGEFQFPQPVVPQLSFSAFLSISIPLCLLVLSNDLAVALASLKGNGFRPPTNRTLVASGIAGMIAGLFGGHAANVGGMMSALCGSPEAGPFASRRWAATVSSLIVIGFGVLSFQVIPVIQALPSSFVSIMTGFSLLGLFLNGLRSIYAERRDRLPALLTFGIAVTQIQFLGISTPVWALLCGVLTAKRMGQRAREQQADQ